MLVDDHPLWRDTIRKVLEHRGFARVVAEASDGAEAVALARRARVDVVVMDIQLPVRSGIDSTRDLVAEQPGIKVLVLASSDDRAQVLAAVDAGASGYLLKTAGPEEIRDAVRRAHAGELVFPAALAGVVLDELRARAHENPEVRTPSTNVVRHEGDYWTVGYGDRVFRLRDTRGVMYLAELLRHPGREFHALDLVVAGKGSPPPRGSVDAGPVLDAEAKAAYRRRLEDLSAAREEAAAWGDAEREARAREEMDAIASELARAVGLGGRDRRAASAAERARVNVTLALRSTLAKIAKHDPGLGDHLDHAIRTGTFCSYSPDPTAPISWEL